MSKPIPPKHLLDMWIRRQSFLYKIYHKEKLDGLSRVNYDCAVLITKYNGYVDWLEKKKVDLEKAESFISHEKINMNDVGTNKNFSINNILDEDGDE